MEDLLIQFCLSENCLWHYYVGFSVILQKSALYSLDLMLSIGQNVSCIYLKWDCNLTISSSIIFCYGHVHIWGNFWLFCGRLNCSYILINYFLLIYKVGINHPPIINKINYLSKNILCLKNDKIVKEIYLRSQKTKKKIKKYITHGFMKKMKRTISSNALN